MRTPARPRERRAEKAKPGQRLTGNERKTNFLAAAHALIRQRGLEALTMEGLAAHCNVNKALPYRHFANRDDVLVALFDHESSEFDAACEGNERGVRLRSEAQPAVTNVVR